MFTALIVSLGYLWLQATVENKILCMRNKILRSLNAK